MAEIIQKKNKKLIHFPSFTHGKIKTIKAGNEFIYLVTTIGELFKCLEPNKQFTKVTNIDNIKLLACGYSHAIFINENNEIYILESALKKSTEFKKINLKNKKIKKVNCGFDSIFIITEDNLIYSSGVNAYGQLGHDNKNNGSYYDFQEDSLNITEFTMVTTLQNICDLQCGDNHTLVLDYFGNIYGAGIVSALNLNNLNNAIKNNDYCGDYIMSFTKIDIPFKVKQISCTAKGSIIVNDIFEIFIVGESYKTFTKLNFSSLQNTFYKTLKVHSSYISSFIYLQTNLNELFYFLKGDKNTELNNLDIPYNNFINLTFYNNATIFVISDYFIEDNYYCNNHLNIEKYFQKLFNCFILSKLIDIDFNNEYLEIKSFTNLRKRIKFINCGYSHTFIVTEDFKCYGLGVNFEDYNNFKEINSLDIEIIKRITQVICGGNHTALILQNGELYVHGDNSCQELDEDTSKGCFKKFVKSKFNKPISDIAFGINHCLMITKSGEVYGSGNNSPYHQLGIENNEEFGFLIENIQNKVNKNVYKNINVSKYFLIYKFYFKLFFYNYYDYNNTFLINIYKDQYSYNLDTDCNKESLQYLDNNNNFRHLNKLLMNLTLNIFSSLYNFNNWFDSLQNPLHYFYSDLFSSNNTEKNEHVRKIAEILKRKLFQEHDLDLKDIKCCKNVIKFDLNNLLLILIPFKIVTIDDINRIDNFYLFIEKSCKFNSLGTEYNLFNYPNDFNEIMKYLNNFYFENHFNYSYYNKSLSFLENQFELKFGKNQLPSLVKPNFKSLNYFYSVGVYLRERIDESVKDILNIFQQYLLNGNCKMNEENVNEYLSNFPLKKEVEYLFDFDFKKLENICYNEELLKVKMVYKYFYNNYNEKEQLKKVKKQLYKNINYFFQKYLNLIIIFQKQIILLMNDKDYSKNYSIHKVNKKNCKTLFFIYGIYLLPIIKKLILFRIEQFMNEKDNIYKLKEINMELKEIADYLLFYNVPQFF
ncbi:hypothetical protein ABK040_008075 [Willaertia magna]